MNLFVIIQGTYWSLGINAKEIKMTDSFCPWVAQSLKGKETWSWKLIVSDLVIINYYKYINTELQELRAK
jgi:hypothetical protein